MAGTLNAVDSWDNSTVPAHRNDEGGEGGTAAEPGRDRIAALDESTWPGYAELVECNGGIFGGCWCMGLHPHDCEASDPKRERTLARVRAGDAHAGPRVRL